MDLLEVSDDCVFCGIIDGTVPSSRVYEDDICLAFMDIRPVNRGQVLVIPKVHAPNLADLDENTAGHMMKIARRISLAIRESDVPCEGINLILSDGEAAMQGFFTPTYTLFREMTATDLVWNTVGTILGSATGRTWTWMPQKYGHICRRYKKENTDSELTNVHPRCPHF